MSDPSSFNHFSSQLVPAVTELVIAELMYLQWMDPKEPIYLYINSTGTTRDDGETVSFEFIQLHETSEIKLLGACISSSCFVKSSAHHGGFQTISLAFIYTST